MVGGELGNLTLFNINQNEPKIIILRHTERFFLLSVLFWESLGFLCVLESKVGGGRNKHL